MLTPISHDQKVSVIRLRKSSIKTCNFVVKLIDMHAPTILKWLPCVPSRSNSNWSKPCANQYICRPSCHVLSTHCPLLYSNKGQNGKRRWILQKSGTIDNKLESQKASNFSQLKKASCLHGQFNQDLNSTIKTGN